MTKNEFIARARIVEYREIKRTRAPNERLVLSAVTREDECFLVRSGSRLQFWITRRGGLMSVNQSANSCFCVTVAAG